MKSLYIYMGYYKTYIMEVNSHGRNLEITKTATVNCGNNFLIGRLNRVDDFADYLSLKLNCDFKKSMGNAILVIASDFVVETVTDAINIESKNKMKEVKELSYKSRHIGLNSINITRLGRNSYNDIYLTTEFDGKRFDMLLEALKKRGVSFKQVVSPMNCLSHISRSIVCPFEVVNVSNNSTNVEKTAVFAINATVNRTTYAVIHNNLPLDVREGSATFINIVDAMSRMGVPFSKVVRLLNKVGVAGFDENNVNMGIGNATEVETSKPRVVGNISELLRQSGSVVEEDTEEQEEETPIVGQNITLVLDDNTATKKSKKQVSAEVRLKEYEEESETQDADQSLTDDEYYKFERELSTTLNNFRKEMQKTLNYFINNCGVKISNILIISPDINGLDMKLGEYGDLVNHDYALQPDATIEVDDFSIINMTGETIDSKFAILYGAILSNNVKGNIYE